ncbi:MAG TPA: creatininase family protein [Candidatus Thermoplasmatota archaeon]|nr:creatininase family protein [Candidatus Thermoplasmatota archaeon]
MRAPLRLGEITSPELAALDPKPLLLIPVGIVEEHGPHLPLDTDSIQAVATCEAAAPRLGALVAPLLAYGNCSATRGFPGSFSLSFDALRAVARDVLADCARHGLRRVALVSGHAGGAHMRALKLAAEEAIERHPELEVHVLCDYELLDDFDPKAAADADVPRWDGHAGAIETSRMLALRPDLVRAGARAHRPDFPPFQVLSPAQARGLFPDGVMGDPTLASERLGRAANAHIVDALVRILRT